MTQVYRTQITVMSKTLTTDASTITYDSTYSGRRIASLRPPYVLVLSTADSGTAQGGTNYAVSLALYDSADGTTYNAVSGFATGSLTTVDGTKRIEKAVQIRPYVKVGVKAVLGTWNSSMVVTGTLTGEGVA